jgi:hypothetical protein
VIVKGWSVEMLRDREEADFLAPVGEQFIVLLRDERRKLAKIGFVHPRAGGCAIMRRVSRSCQV